MTPRPAPAPTPQPAAGTADWQTEFVERVVTLGDTTGLPPSFTRVFAWLVVCDPPQQSAEELRTTLRLSAGAVSAATSTLARMGIIDRVTRPGERRLRYRLRPDAWRRLLESRLEATSRLRSAADDALAQAPKPQHRLCEMREFYAWFEDLAATSRVGAQTTPAGGTRGATSRSRASRTTSRRKGNTR